MLDSLGKSKFRSLLLKPFIVKINPNIITWLSLVAAIIAGFFFWQDFLILAALFTFLNGFLDVLDGEIAKKFNMQTKLGDFLDHTFDRFADVAILLGITLSPRIPDWLGYGTIIAVLLVSYLGTQAQALTSERLYSALMGRGDRILIITIASLLALVYSPSLLICVGIILVLSVGSIVQRTIATYSILKKSQAKAPSK